MHTFNTIRCVIFTCADASQLTLQHGTENKTKNKEEKLKTKTDMFRRDGQVESREGEECMVGRICEMGRF